MLEVKYLTLFFVCYRCFVCNTPRNAGPGASAGERGVGEGEEEEHDEEEEEDEGDDEGEEENNEEEVEIEELESVSDGFVPDSPGDGAEAEESKDGADSTDAWEAICSLENDVSAGEGPPLDVTSTQDLIGALRALRQQLQAEGVAALRGEAESTRQSLLDSMQAVLSRTEGLEGIFESIRSGNGGSSSSSETTTDAPSASINTEDNEEGTDIIKISMKAIFHSSRNSRLWWMEL